MDGDAAGEVRLIRTSRSVEADTNGEEAKADAKENGEEEEDEVNEDQDQDKEKNQDQEKEEEDKEEADVEAVKAEQPAMAADDEADVQNEGDEAKGREGPPSAPAAPPTNAFRGRDVTAELMRVDVRAFAEP